MHVLILAAGFGTRLQEFGETTPKGLIPTKDGTLIEKILHDVVPLSTGTALVTNSRFFSIYKERLASYMIDVQIISDGAGDPDHRLGALGDILFILDQLHWWDEDVLVVPSDTYYEFSMKAFVSFAKEKNAFTTVLRDMESTNLIANRLGCAVIDGTTITQFVEKPANPPSTLAAIPFYFYPTQALPKLLDYKTQGGVMDAPGSIIPWLLSQDIPVHAYLTDGKTVDVGTPADLEIVRGL